MSIETIKSEMHNAGIPSTGIYTTMPSIVLDAIETVKMFGFQYWNERTSVGIKVKELVKKLSN